MEIVENKKYTGKDFTASKLAIAEYDGCVFKGCVFSKVKLSRMRFIECEFIDCDFSSAPLHDTSFQDASFESCKMLGLHFEDCNSFNFAAHFMGCKLDDSSFYQVKIKKLTFEGCSFDRVDFTEADASKVSFPDCSFIDAVFDNSILEQADFSTAIGFRIDPTSNRIKGAIFSKEGALGLLDRFGVVISQQDIV